MAEQAGLILNAVAITEQTTIAVRGSFPLEIGNCFSVRTEGGSHFKIVNFVLENLEEALQRKHIAWPIKIKVLDGCIAGIHDERIPDNWYKDRFCEVCCPKHLLPVPQILAHERWIARGDRQEKDGYVSIKYPGLQW